jgi:mannose-6-phosphate isomerase-like protein (cupin superfamily)/glycosyltransferase involved in cell wall biosynthesis
MRIAMLSPLPWRPPCPQDHPWQKNITLLIEGLMERGVEVVRCEVEDAEDLKNLSVFCFPPGQAEEDMIIQVGESLPLSRLIEQASRCDLIHNYFHFLPLIYSALIPTAMVTTLHGFSPPPILSIYKKFNGQTSYVSISNADRNADLDYLATVYHGLDLQAIPFNRQPGSHLLFWGRIQEGEGAWEAIQIAQSAGHGLVIAGPVTDQLYFKEKIVPHLDGSRLRYVGAIKPADMPGLLAGSLALVHCTHLQKPFALNLIEVMASGVPVIAFPRGSIPEMVEEGRNGFLVQDLDSARHALEKARKMERRECRRVAEERFSHEKMVEGYLKVYETLFTGVLSWAKRGHRPWGEYTVLEDHEAYKVKRIEVGPGQRLSYQKHERRSEHWTIVRGQARVTLNGKEIDLLEGQAIDIPRHWAHRISNPGRDILIFIEIQKGDYFGEDDIIRLEDDYGRGEKS